MPAWWGGGAVDGAVHGGSQHVGTGDGAVGAGRGDRVHVETEIPGESTHERGADGYRAAIGRTRRRGSLGGAGRGMRRRRRRRRHLLARRGHRGGGRASSSLRGARGRSIADEDVPGTRALLLAVRLVLGLGPRRRGGRRRRCQGIGHFEHRGADVDRVAGGAVQRGDNPRRRATAARRCSSRSRPRRSADRS